MKKDIELTFLGTGSAFSKKFGNNSVIVTVQNGDVIKNLMIDCGRTTPGDLHESEFEWNDLDAIFITHLHGDHVYGLEEAGFFGRYVLNKRPHLIFPHEKLKLNLWNNVLSGTMMDGDLDREMTFDDYFTYEIVDDTEQYFIFNEVMFSVYPTQHVKNKMSYGLIIGEYNYVVYTSDSLFDLSVLRVLIGEGAQMVFHDCQFSNYEGKVHTSIDELEQLEEKEREAVTIMHYSDSIDEYFTRIKDSGMNIAISGVKYKFAVN